MAPVWEWPANELPQNVMDAVDCLDSGSGILERRVGKGTLRDVDQETDAVGNVFIQSPLQLQD